MNQHPQLQYMAEQSSEERSGLEVAVVGMAGRFPGADDVRAFWRNLREGVESVTRFTREQLQVSVHSGE